MNDNYEIGSIVKAKFATLNKNETLDQYKEECSRDQYKEECSRDQIQEEVRMYGNIKEVDTWKTWEIEECKIEQYFRVTPEEWEKLTNSFLDDNILWREKGGAIYTGHNVLFDENLLGSDSQMLQDFRLNNARLITIIENGSTGESIAIDPQGYKYARYVGIDVEA